MESVASSEAAKAGQTRIQKENTFTRYDGVMGGENQYAFLVPDDWNGDLVLYAHGFIDAQQPLALPTKDNIEPIRDRIVALGYAFAYCSYRENGLAIKDGAWATRRLKKVFHAVVGSKPQHTWLVAHSMGGLIAVELAEKHPDEYDGVLTLSGMIGGTAAQLDYVANVRILFDALYGDVVRGSVLDVPYDMDLTVDVIQPVAAAVEDNPQGAFIISQIEQTPLPFTSGVELAQSLITALGFNIRGIHDVLERTHGATPIDNMHTQYCGAVPEDVLEMLNEHAQRYERPRPAQNILDLHYEPSGQLSIPMIALHDRWDPTVPLFHEDLYAAKVEASGNSEFLQQRVVDRYGHSDFSEDEVEAALRDLRAWAIDGTR